MKSHVGVVQMNSSDNVEGNLAFAKLIIEQAANEGLDLISFPETFLYIGNDHQKKRNAAQTLNGEVVQAFRDLAIKFKLSILMGSIYEQIPDDDRLFNTSILINQQGDIDAIYRKIHLFDAPLLGHQESDGIKAGSNTVVIDHEIGKIGLTICYDLRFPELYRNLTAQGAEIIFVPSAFFHYTGQHHWLQLLTARAIENQVYIVAPNQWGEHHQGRESFGKSVIIDPWGSIKCLAEDKSVLASAEIDLGYLRELRASMPLLTHRRPELY